MTLFLGEKGRIYFRHFFCGFRRKESAFLAHPLEPVLACYKRVDVCSWTNKVGGCRLAANIYTSLCLLILLRTPAIRNYEFIMIFMIRRIRAILWKKVYKSNYSQKEVQYSTVQYSTCSTLYMYTTFCSVIWLYYKRGDHTGWQMWDFYSVADRENKLVAIDWMIDYHPFEI